MKAKAFFAKGCLLSAVTAALLEISAGAAHAQSGPISLTLNSAGVQSFTVGGVDFLLHPANEPQFKVFAILGNNSTCHYEQPIASTLSGNVINQTYVWGTSQIQYTTTATTLTMQVSCTNDSSENMSAVQFNLFGIAFPGNQTPHYPNDPKLWDNSNPPRADTANGPPVLVGDWGNGVVALVDNQLTPRSMVAFGYKYWGGYPMVVKTPGPLLPGQSVSLAVSLRFGPEGSTDQTLASDVIDLYSARQPQVLSWKDRRPIGSVFLATVDQKYPTNPRGWFNDSRINVFTTAGLASFKQRMIAQANEIVANLTRVNAQGCIVWDIEGEQYPQGTFTYAGDPTMIETLAPEMDGVADQFFNTILANGFRTGVLLRADYLQPFSQGGWVQYPFNTATDMFNALNARVEYAKNRWGCTLFYIDSIPPGVPTVVQQLQAAHPDCLFIPEEKETTYYAYTAPYDPLKVYTPTLGGVAITPAGVRDVYPGAFSVLNVADGDITDNAGTLTAAVSRGDILMFRSWFWSPESPAVQAIYMNGTASRSLVLYPDQYMVQPGSTTVLPVVTPAFSQEGPTNIVVTGFTNPGLGSVSLQNGQVIYQAPPQSGTTSFNFTAFDGVNSATSSVQLFISN
jgi:hypothetical protein